jgi:hypothetical protein
VTLDERAEDVERFVCHQETNGLRDFVLGHFRRIREEALAEGKLAAEQELDARIDQNLAEAQRLVDLAFASPREEKPENENTLERLLKWKEMGE